MEASTSTPRSQSEVTYGEKEDLNFKPRIAEILRTDYCIPSIVLLVTKIQVLKVLKSEEDLEAYRLWLNDGEKVIQGLLRTEMHRFVATGEIIEGSYVQLDHYCIGISPRTNGDGHVAYLAIHDIHTVGHDRRFPRQPVSFEIKGETKLKEEPTKKRPLGLIEGFSSAVTNDQAPREEVSFGYKELDSPVLRARNPAPRILSAEDDPAAVQNLQLFLSTRPRTFSFYHEAIPAHFMKCFASLLPLYRRPKYPPSPEAACKTLSTYALTSLENFRPLTPLPAPPPRKVHNLADFLALKPTQNRICNVFACVLSMTEQLSYPSAFNHPKRDVQLIDWTRELPITLSVWVEAESFAVAKGTPVLFLNIKNHRFGGGSLNAYRKDCEGRDWYIPNPEGVEGCDVSRMRKFWTDWCNKERSI